MTNRQEALASLLVLICVAKADGSISSSEQAVLTEALEQLPAEASRQPRTLDRLLIADIPLPDLLQTITTPATQQAVYDAARSLAEQDGIHPQQQQLLNQIQAHFQGAIAQTSQSEADSELDNAYESLATGIQAVIGRNRQVRNLVFDYALGAAAIGLIPLPNLLMVQLVVVIVLVFKMKRDIGALWGFPKGHDLLAWVGSGFGSLGSFAVALMAWFTVLAIGAVIPYVGSLARAAAFATLIWVQGQAANQFYLSSGRMNQVAFQQMMRKLPARADNQPAHRNRRRV